jgi:glucose-6-phosphate isomerase
LIAYRQFSTLNRMWSIDNSKSKTSAKHAEAAANSLLQLLSRKDIGFFKLDERKSELSAIQSLADKKRAQFNSIAVLGIGGSALGALALFESVLPEWIENKKILFFDNVDSVAFYRKLHGIKNPEQTLWVLISKSGSTVETLMQAECIDVFLKSKGLQGIAEQSVVITESKSSDLYDWAQKNKVDALAVPLDVGGRYSVLTSVGLFPAAFAGIDISKLLLGAEKALASKELCVQLLAEYVAAIQRGAPAAYFFAYCDDLKNFGMWIEQLWAESIGKKQNTKGEKAPAAPIPITCRGATDQHSVLQQVAHGTQDKIVTFFRVGSAENASSPLQAAQFKTTQSLVSKSIGQLLRAEAIATEQALQEENVQTVSLYSEKLTAESMGFLFMAFELLVGGLGTYMDINPFDQPGVERGKVLARAILKQH